MNHPTNDQLPFRGLETPPPDPRLRPRVLQAARRAAAEARLSPLDRFIDAVWSSRSLRVAWLVATLALFAANADLGRARADASALPMRMTTLAELEAAGGHHGGMNPRQVYDALIRDGA